MKVFFDTSVLKHSIRWRSTIRPQTVSWGPHKIIVNVAVDEPKSHIEGWLGEQICSMERILPLVSNRLIEPCICAETIFDSLGLGGFFSDWSNFSMFPRGYFVEVAEPEIFGRTRIAFGRDCKPRDVRKQFLATNLYSRFNILKQVLGGNKNADAFLIWTAESAGVPYFLTTDKKLVNAARNQEKCAFGTHLLFPSELVALLNLERDNNQMQPTHFARG